MDLETTDFYERVRASYLEIAAKEKKRFKVVDASGSIENIQSEVVKVVTGFLEK